jgi:hypothetical protein
MNIVYLFIAYLILRQIYRLFLAPRCPFCNSILEKFYCYGDCLKDAKVERVWCDSRSFGFHYSLSKDKVVRITVYPKETTIGQLDDNYWTSMITLPGHPLTPQNIHNKFKLYMLFS